MAQKFLSPGVFTTEIDRSFLAQGVAGIGAAIVGSAEKGPAFQPVVSANFSEWVDRMGTLNPIHQGSYAAKNYLANSAVLNYVRVLGHADGTSVTPGYTVGGITAIVDMTGSNAQVLAVVHHSGTIALGAVSVSGVAGDADRFTFRLSADGGATTTFGVTASFLTSSADYIAKVLNTDPTRYSTDGHYLYQVFKYATPAASASWDIAAVSGTLSSFAKPFEGGVTPWIKSQLLGGNEYNLFKFHTLADGRSTNDEVKVSIQNVKPSSNPLSNPWGTFDVVVRKFYDVDTRPVVLENFVGLTLNPKDRNYIARRIGDVNEVFNTVTRKMAVDTGEFPNRSRHIRVQINKNNGAPPEALPWGFRGFVKMAFENTNAGGGGVSHLIPSIAYRPNQLDTNGNFNTNLYWGVLFTSGGVVDRMRSFPLLTAAQTGLAPDGNQDQDTDFSLTHLSGAYSNGTFKYEYNTAVTSYAPIFLSSSLQKFTVPFQGGFDGFDLTVENPLDITNSADDTNLAVVSLKRALDIVANPDFIDINLLAVPGVDNLKVTDHARLLANDRADLLYIMDITGSTVSEAVENLRIREIDDNYTATYYPDVKVDDDVNNLIVRLKPSAVILGTMAFSDRTAQPWFAPAGLNRGGLSQFNVNDIVDRVDFEDRNTLSDNRINPIASFPNEGVNVFGQKTLQVAASALDRINVRRLLIFAKKTVAAAAKLIVFEPADPATYQQFTSTVNPILNDIRLKRGLERFKVVMDANLNTPDVVDQNRIIGKIFLQPTKAAEYIDLQFVITNAGVSFDD